MSSEFAKLVGALAEFLPRLLEPLRIGALEAVDRLLEVADHEQSPVPLLAFARPAEIFRDQRTDNVPLRGVGVLCLVDQYVVDLAIKLVADPVANSGLLEQVPGPVDEIVEVGDARCALGAGVGYRERLAGAQSGRDVRSQTSSVLDP